MEKLNREQKFSLSYNVGNKGPQIRVVWGKVQNNSKCVFFSFSSLALDFSATGCCEYQTSTEVEKAINHWGGRGKICQRLLKLKPITEISAEH